VVRKCNRPAFISNRRLVVTQPEHLRKPQNSCPDSKGTREGRRPPDTLRTSSGVRENLRDESPRALPERPSSTVEVRFSGRYALPNRSGINSTHCPAHRSETMNRMHVRMARNTKSQRILQRHTHTAPNTAERHAPSSRFAVYRSRLYPGWPALSLEV